MKKQIGKNLMQKWNNKTSASHVALETTKLLLTYIQYILTAF